MVLNSKIFNYNMLINLIIFIISLYLIYHLLYGQFNVGNFLINQFYETLLDDKFLKINNKIIDINKELNALYTNKEDFLDEITKQKYPEITSPGEVLIKIN